VVSKINFKGNFMILKLTQADKILIACLLAFNLFLFSKVGYSTDQGNWVVIEVDQKEVARLALAKNQIVHVTGPLGETEVEVKDGQARIRRSPCNKKLCIKSGFIRYADRISACLPNRVVVRIQSRSHRGIDAILS